MSKRGRKPTPCPAGFRELAEEYTNPTALAMKLGRNRRIIIRWLADIGMPHEARPQRPRNVTPRWLALANVTSGRRVRTRLYEVWASMRKRCLVPSCPDFPRYGGRGVTICDSWLRDYGAFRSWAVTHGYRKGLTLDRKDGNGNYEPDNCRFITKSDQQLNIRRGIKLTVDGETRSLAEWARVSGLDPELIRSRIYNGWPHKRAVFEASSR